MLHCYYLLGIVPLSCQDVYSSFNSAVCFVTAIYGTVVLVLLSMILIHQSRLVWRGVSYLDWKYAGRTPNELLQKEHYARYLFEMIYSFQYVTYSILFTSEIRTEPNTDFTSTAFCLAVSHPNNVTQDCNDA
ncbi:unnamed protein product [Allacma fusca]|uniref:Uncharacterized protein n=1 Tax=Allacma fusca TaxID=39272 RepID=A0A8J2LQE8_9HEXA|nr:unnamed protein product [Allacma fusca]